MKAKLFSVTAALSFLLFLSAVSAFAQFPTTCSNALLRGDYGFTVDGKIIPPGGTAFVAQQGVALQHFDGAGNFTAVDFIMTNGVPAINPSTAVNSNGFRTNERGTYTVNPDCTGKLTLNQYTKFDTLAATIEIKFVLVKSGKEIREVVQSITAFPPSGEVNIPATILSTGKKLEPLDDEAD
jgi:hypothetical protein